MSKYNIGANIIQRKLMLMQEVHQTSNFLFKNSSPSKEVKNKVTMKHLFQ